MITLTPRPATIRMARMVAVIAALALLASAAALMSCGGNKASAGSNQKAIVLGFDGMDYTLTKQMIAEGRLPNFAKLASQGSFTPLATSIPPQSPVAWSNFITGLDAGGHGIFDFIHRDPKTLLPYLSTSRAESSGKVWKFGKYQIPLGSDKIELLRYGTPFWQVLEEKGIRTSILRMPANFPPSGTATLELSGMGTPDIIGSYGTFSFYTSQPEAYSSKDMSGGQLYPVKISADGVVSARLEGPTNPFYVKSTKIAAEFKAYIDPKEPVARIVVGATDIVLKQGEWSEWVPVELKLVPTQSIGVICRFYLQQVHPNFNLYVTPLDLDPMSPAMTISTPASYAKELAEETGLFYTQGMPEETKAFKDGVFTPDEFLAQAKIAGDDVTRQYRYVLDHFKEGLLFYYWGNGDQISHMMWRSMDPGHPLYKEADAKYKDVIPQVYEGFDKIVGETLAKMDSNTTLVVMSDHGFTSWRRAFHLNTWLRDNGYLAVIDASKKDDAGMFSNVDWSKTRAYGLGINGLYINLRGRERNGIVAPEDRKALMDEISAKLLATTDPKDGARAVTRMSEREEAFHDRGHIEVGPDIVVGYAKMYRGSNESALGKLTAEVITDNNEEWSGDHCMDPDAVPGILFSSRPLKQPAASLKDLAGSILNEFGIAGFPDHNASEGGSH